MQCPACAAELPEEDRFCESCGVSLTAPAAAPPGCTCGASEGETDEDGFCLRCGRRVQRPASDHVEQSLSPLFAAVSDRGVRHDRNEDRFRLAQSGGFSIAVVCDGVSATRKSEVASTTVSESVAAALAASSDAGAITDPEQAMRRAIATASADLAAKMPRDERENAPSTTVVAALVNASEAVVGWIGDSRAYWIGPNGALQLTRDHSWMNEVVAAGRMTPAQAEASPQSHGITRWIGADADPDSGPEIVRHSIAGPGALLLCSDGLWNYARTPEEISRLFVEASSAGADALAAARSMVQFANQRGGQDNITVALVRFDRPPRMAGVD